LGGAAVKPWRVLPGKWLQVTDFLPGSSYATLLEDPRCMFIERVSFSIPWDVQLQGGDTDTAPQVLAQQGLAGRSS
jgi:hypothetical protein